MKKLMLLTYTPRALDEEEYARFLREADYPTFRQNPHVLDYTCWRIQENVLGEQRFSHFDLMEIDEVGNWPAITEDPKVKAHLARWSQEWSRYGAEGDPAANFQVAYAERYWG